jgi:hypothetical protein
MRVAIAVIILAVSFPLNGCSRPQQAVYANPIWSSGMNQKSRQRPPKPKASAKPSQPISKLREPAGSVRPRQAVRTEAGPSKSSSAEPPPPLPQRRPEQASTNAPAPSHEGSNIVEQAKEAKFKAAEAKAKREGVDSLTRQDIEGLTPEQLKKIRGY